MRENIKFVINLLIHYYYYREIRYSICRTYCTNDNFTTDFPGLNWYIILADLNRYIKFMHYFRPQLRILLMIQFIEKSESR